MNVLSPESCRKKEGDRKMEGRGRDAQMSVTKKVCYLRGRVTSIPVKIGRCTLWK